MVKLIQGKANQFPFNSMLEIPILGVLASLVIAGIKKWLGTSDWSSKVATVIVSIVLGGVYYFLRGTSVWGAILGVLTWASAVYAFFIKQ